MTTTRNHTIDTSTIPVDRTDAILCIIDEVRAELDRATSQYGPMNSAHEGYAIILEELDELWDHVKHRPDRRVLSEMRAEAVQVAAMAIRFALDCCNEERGRR